MQPGSRGCRNETSNFEAFKTHMVPENCQWNYFKAKNVVCNCPQANYSRSCDNRCQATYHIASWSHYTLSVINHIASLHCTKVVKSGDEISLLNRFVQANRKIVQPTSPDFLRPDITFNTRKPWNRIEFIWLFGIPCQWYWWKIFQCRIAEAFEFRERFAFAKCESGDSSCDWRCFHISVMKLEMSIYPYRPPKSFPGINCFLVSVPWNTFCCKMNYCHCSFENKAANETKWECKVARSSLRSVPVPEKVVNPEEGEELSESKHRKQNAFSRTLVRLKAI